MFVGMAQLTRFYFSAKYFNFTIPANRPSMAVANTEPSGYGLKSGIGHLIQVAHSTMTAIMGRMSAYTGKHVTWDQILNSKLQLTPPDIAAWDAAEAEQLSTAPL